MDMKIGFYEELEIMQKEDTEANFGFLETTRVTSESSAFNFLHGCCDEFAAMLSNIYGYEVEAVRNAEGKLIHAYCVSTIGGEKAYIDVRGITTDPVLFFGEFADQLTYYPQFGSFIVIDEDGCEREAVFESWDDKDSLFDGEYKGWEDWDIEKFILLNGGYYDANRHHAVYQCKACGEEIEEDSEDLGWFDEYGEEDLWGHIQRYHEDLYAEYQTLETPDMLDLCYDKKIIHTPGKPLDFVFDEEIMISDDLAHLEGYLWATRDLVFRLKMYESHFLTSDEITSMDNINFYPVYDVANHSIKLHGHFYYQSAAGEIGKAFEMPLREEEAARLINEFESYCKMQYEVSCIELLNDERKQQELPPLGQDSLVDRIASAEARGTSPAEPGDVQRDIHDR